MSMLCKLTVVFEYNFSRLAHNHLDDLLHHQPSQLAW